MVCRIFYYSHYTAAVGVPVGGRRLALGHSFRICHNSGTCKTLSYDSLCAAHIWLLLMFLYSAKYGLELDYPSCPYLFLAMFWVLV